MLLCNILTFLLYLKRRITPNLIFSSDWEMGSYQLANKSIIKFPLTHHTLPLMVSQGEIIISLIAIWYQIVSYSPTTGRASDSCVSIGKASDARSEASASSSIPSASPSSSPREIRLTATTFSSSPTRKIVTP